MSNQNRTVHDSGGCLRGQTERPARLYLTPDAVELKDPDAEDAWLSTDTPADLGAMQ